MITPPQDFYRYSVLEVMDELELYDDYNFMKIMEVAHSSSSKQGLTIPLLLTKMKKSAFLHC